MEAKNYLVGDVRKHLNILDEFTEVRVNDGTDFQMVIDYNKGNPYINFIEKKTAEPATQNGQMSDI